MMGKLLFPSIHAARKPLKRFLTVIRYARLDWLCTKMARPPTTVVPVKNSAAHSASPSVAFAPVTIRTGITGRKTVVALNTESFHRTTGFPLTAAASISRGHTLCVQSAKGTPPALRRLGRNDYGCVTAETVRQTSIRWPTFPLSLLLLPLFSLALTPTVHLISFRRAT